MWCALTHEVPEMAEDQCPEKERCKRETGEEEKDVDRAEGGHREKNCVSRFCHEHGSHIL